MHLSFHVGQAGGQRDRAHNLREGGRGSRDPEREKLNKVLLDVDPAEVIREELSGAVEDFNARCRKKHPERAKDLDTEVKKGLEKVREIILQVGDMTDHLPDQEAAHLLFTLAKDFMDRNPSICVCGAYIHMDESTPHIHLDVIPFHESKRGMAVQVSLEGALGELGYKSSGKYSETAFKQWALDERRALEATASAYLEQLGDDRYALEPFTVRSKDHQTRHFEQWQQSERQAKEAAAELEKTKAELMECRKVVSAYTAITEHMGVIRQTELARQAHMEDAKAQPELQIEKGVEPYAYDR